LTPGQNVSDVVVNDLLAVPAAELTGWKDALRPVRHKLLAPLSVVYRSVNRPAERSRATELLADYAADQPDVLASLLLDADDKQFAVIYPRLQSHRERGAAILTTELGREMAPPVTSDWTVRFYKWNDAGPDKPPVDWEAVLKSPILDELRMSRLHLFEVRVPPVPLTSRVPGMYFALVATTEVTLGDGAYIIGATADDGVRVWLDNELVIDDWGPPHSARTKSVTVDNKPGRHQIKVEYYQSYGAYVLDVDLTISNADREKLAKQQAKAAAALLQMGQAQKSLPLLKHAPDPRARSYLIHALSPLGVDARAIVKQLNIEPDVTIRRALLLSLGEFSEKTFTPEDRKALLPKLQGMYQTEPDAGLHAASEWLLRQWKDETWLKETNQAWAEERQQLKRLETIEQELKKETGKEQARWYVNGQGQTFVVIPGPVEFWMGSPPTEVGRAGGPVGTEEQRHWRRIGRSFAIASKEVTKNQFLRFRQDHPVDGRAAPLDDCPVNAATWYDAAAYCNWLSEQEGIPRDQWCYEPNEKGEYAEGMKLAANYLQRTGYRLPTEAEWEFACRAGAATSFSFGESEELLPRYAWYSNHSQNKSWPVGSLKPNDLGLFDMNGNVWEWCQEAPTPYRSSGIGTATEEVEEVAEITNAAGRALRGGSFPDAPLTMRSALRNAVVPTYRGSPNIGFRPVRTLPFSSFDRYAAARAAAKAKLRGQALDWLKAELAAWSKVQPPRLFVARNLWQWQHERDLAGIRDEAELAKLLPEERKAFTQLWADVAKMAEPANGTERVEFARLAALIAAGQGVDEPPLDEKAKVQLRGQAFDWLKAELPVTADRAGKARIVVAAAPLPDLLEKLAGSAPNDGRFQAELARHHAQRGNNQPARAARTKARAVFESQLAKEPDNATVATELAELLLGDTTPWTILKPAAMKSEGGATLTTLEDNSILVSGPNPAQDVYTLIFRNCPPRIQQLRLEVLPHESLPSNGPGRHGAFGNFALTTVKAHLDLATDMSGERNLILARAFADFSQNGWNVGGAIDSDDNTGWAIDREEGKPHFALFELAEPVRDTPGATLRVTLEFKSKHPQHGLGRFRLSASADPATFDREEKRLAALKHTDPWLKLAATYELNGRNDRAVEYYARALRLNPKLSDDRQAQPRYHAARAAALAATRQGKDEPPLDDAARAKLRGQALEWLKAELTAWNKVFNSDPPQDRPGIVQTLSSWQQDPDLAGIRDAAALARLPADEQKAWQTLWARVPQVWSVVPTSKEQGQKWRYTTQQPVDGWSKADFDDQQWQQGIGGFGSGGGDAVRTEWNTADIWLRREFTLPEGTWDDLLLLIQHDDDAEVYINGVLALKAPGVSGYEEMPLSAEARKGLKPGKNVFAVHCHQFTGPQYIDVGIVAVKGNPGRLALAYIAWDRKRFALATELSAAALASDPTVSDDRLAAHRARVALLAAAGQSHDEPVPDDAAKAKLRGQALTWLKAELAWLGKQLERDRSGERAAVEAVLLGWQKDGFLAGIRNADALARLPADEQKACTQFWDDVAALLAQAEGAVGNDAFRLPGVARPNAFMAQDRECKWLAVPTADKVAVFDARTGELRRTLTGHTDRVFAVAFSPDGKSLAAGNLPGAGKASTVKVWDLETGAVIATLESGSGGGIWGVNFSADGKRIFGTVWGPDGGVRMWDVTGKLVRSFKASGNTAGLAHLALSLDGKRVVSNDTPQTVKVWDIEGDNPPVTLGGHTDQPLWAAYSPDGKWLATGSVNELLLWDAGTLKLVKKIATPANWLAFEPGGKSLLTAPLGERPLATSVVMRWDLATYGGKPLPPLTGRTGFPVYHLSPDGRRLYSQVCDGADVEGRIRVYDAATGADVEDLPLQALAKRFPALLRGEDKPADNAERLDFARIAHDQKNFVFATNLWAEALAADPKLAADRKAQHRYKAARAAALAATGQARDERQPEAAQAKLRGQALDWLKAELTAWKKLSVSGAEYRPAVWQALVAWQQDGALAGIRDAAALDKLPAEEQKAFNQFWTDVAEILQKCKVKLEIIKAEYGAGAKQMDVTESLRKHVVDLPLITLPSADFNQTFGDPLYGIPKQLKIEYKINGHPGEATFPEFAPILLSIPKGAGDLGALKPPVSAPFTDADVQRISALPVAEQIEEVCKELKKRNPEFAGKFDAVVEKGQVIGLNITMDGLTDLAPVRAFTGLQRLTSVGTLNGSVCDLGPLRGLPLRQLDLYGNSELTDLTPLAGMKLEMLNLWGWGGSDLTPLKGMPLKWLDCAGGKQKLDLTPLAGAPLETLIIHTTEVSDLVPLRDLRLKMLDVRHTKVADLSPLKGMPLTELFLEGTAVSDLGVLKDLALKKLSCDFRAERDARILRSIKTLEEINGVSVEKFWKEADEKGKKE
jgi:formylglycine-generating enzyme required for sulfatase activity/WD40 repeat protein